MAGSPIGELGDFLKANPSYTEKDYMYKLSIAKIQLLTHDFTHVKYLSDADKEMWSQAAKVRNGSKVFEAHLKMNSDKVTSNADEWMRKKRERIAKRLKEKEEAEKAKQDNNN